MLNKPLFSARFTYYWNISSDILCRISIRNFIEISSASLLIQPYKALVYLRETFTQEV